MFILTSLVWFGLVWFEASIARKLVGYWARSCSGVIYVWAKAGGLPGPHDSVGVDCFAKLDIEASNWRIQFKTMVLGFLKISISMSNPKKRLEVIENPFENSN